MNGVNESVDEATRDQLADTWFSLLPSEVLLHIFKMLPSDTLLLLENMSDDRIKQITYDKSVTSTVNFSKCNRLTSLLDLKNFFHSARASVITQLNFNNCAWIGPTFLLNCIIKCKHLTVLSVRDCGLHFANLVDVLQKTPNLSSLEWSVDMQNCEKYPRKLVEKYTSLKKLEKLHLYYLDNPINIVKSMSYFLPCCTNLKELMLHVVINLVDPSGCLHPSLPLIPSNVQTSRVLENFVAIFDVKNLIYQNSLESVSVMLNELSRIIFTSNRSSHWKTIWVDDSFHEASHIVYGLLKHRLITSENLSNISCIKLKGTQPCSDILENAPRNNIRTLCIEKIIMSNKCFNIIAQSLGDNLKHLQIRKSITLENFKLPDLLTPFFATCNNITEINFLGIHTFPEDSPCSALCALKGLKRVLLMSCHLKRIVAKDSDVNDPLLGLGKRKRVVEKQKQVIYHAFQDMVKNCKLVEVFHLMDCCYTKANSRHESCEDEDIAPISQWTNLKTLSLFRLERNLTLNCLRGIALHCRRFESLNIEHASTNTLMPNLCSLLSSSVPLSTVRIVHNNLRLTSPFWISVGHAKNLKNLCLVAGFHDHVENDVIVENLAKLKHLELFHLVSSISNVQKLHAAISKNVFGLHPGRKEEEKPLRKSNIVISKVNIYEEKLSHHICNLCVDPFSVGIGNPVSGCF